MTVTSWRIEERRAIGDLEWAAAPGLRFTMIVEPDGRVTELRIGASQDTASVTSTGQRSIPVATMKRRLLAEIADHELELARRKRAANEKIAQRNASGRPDLALAHRREADYLASALEQVGDFLDRPRTGSAGRGDARYAGIAAMYVDLWSNEGDATPVKTLADRLGLSDKTVRNLLYKARERGLLTSAGGRRVGGELTEKAKEILDGKR